MKFTILIVDDKHIFFQSQFLILKCKRN